MKKIKSYSTLGECDRAKTLLTGSGIACFIKNEFSANTVAAGPLGSLLYAQPELWIMDDDDEEDARKLLDNK